MGPVPAVHEHELEGARAQASEELLMSQLGLAVTACVEVNRGVPTFGPSMDRQMRFLNNNHAAHALGREHMKRRGDNCCSRRDGSPLHQHLDKVEVVEQLRVTAPVFHQKMAPECVQYSILLSQRPSTICDDADAVMFPKTGGVKGRVAPTAVSATSAGTYRGLSRDAIQNVPLHTKFTKTRSPAAFHHLQGDVHSASGVAS